MSVLNLKIMIFIWPHLFQESAYQAQNWLKLNMLPKWLRNLCIYDHIYYYQYLITTVFIGTQKWFKHLRHILKCRHNSCPWKIYNFEELETQAKRLKFVQCTNERLKANPQRANSIQKVLSNIVMRKWGSSKRAILRSVVLC